MQKLQLSIPEPCHENWQTMTPTEQGRFCNACAKEVIDFSMMTDMEVLNYFTTLTHEKVCGRALPSQLERNISYPKEPKKRLFWYWNYIVMFFMFFGKGNNAKAQGSIKTINQTEVVNGISTDIMGGTIVSKALCTKRPEKKSENINNENLAAKVAGAKVRSTAEAKAGRETIVRMGSISAIAENSRAIYVVDGVIVNGQPAINPDDIEDISVLQTPAATALYGSDGANGAIVINRKLKVKIIDTVVVRSGFTLKGQLGGMTVTSVRANYFSEIKATISTKINDSIKIFPNPASKNSSFSVSLRLKDVGKYNLVITDAAGRMVMRKFIQANAKNHNEQMNTENWSSGLYYIRIFDAKNKLISKSSFIVQ